MALLLYVVQLEHVASGGLIEAGLFEVTGDGMILLAGARGQADPEVSASAEQSARGSAEAERLAEELELLINGAPSYAIYLLDPQGNVTIWNSGAERLTGSLGHVKGQEAFGVDVIDVHKRTKLRVADGAHCGEEAEPAVLWCDPIEEPAQSAPIGRVGRPDQKPDPCAGGEALGR